MTGISIDRTSLGLGPLVIGVDGAAPYSLTDGGLGRPAVSARATSVTSPWVHGETVVNVVRDQTSIPLSVLVQGATEAALAVARDALDAALWQFVYEVTITEGTTSTTWQCTPASWGIDNSVVTPANVTGHFEVWTVTLPTYPIPVEG